jgi:hypothetical protein
MSQREQLSRALKQLLDAISSIMEFKKKEPANIERGESSTSATPDLD